ncbi:hypothetical protein [Brevibacillus brevis]|nr:hypothetical protein [Brevibacillus brevis]
MEENANQWSRLKQGLEGVYWPISISKTKRRPMILPIIMDCKHYNV